MASIFSDPLSDITYEDLERWATDSPVPAEGERLDFKREFSSSVTQSIVSMCNRSGGVILIGVDEAITAGNPKAIVWPPVGVSLDRCIDTLQNHCHQYIQPTYLPECRPVSIPSMPDKAVLVVRVDPQTVPRPLWHSEKGVLFRVGDSNRPAGLDTLRRLFSLENGGSALEQDYQLVANRLGRANANGTWLSGALLFPEAAKVFDSHAKHALLSTVARWFWTQPDARGASPYKFQSYAGYLSIAIPSKDDSSVPDFELTLKSTGLVTMRTRIEQSSVPLQWLFDRLARLFAMIVQDDDFAKIFGGGYVSRMQISLANWPGGGVTPDGLFSASSLGDVETLGHTVMRHYGPVARSKDAFLETEEAFCSDVLQESSLIDFESPLHAILSSYGWIASGAPFTPLWA